MPTRAGVRDAAAKVAQILPATPLFTADVRGATIAFKAESLQPIGAFKIRGAWHRLTALDEAQRAAVRAALRPLLDQMKFDLAAAERGAMQPANAD